VVSFPTNLESEKMKPLPMLALLAGVLFATLSTVHAADSVTYKGDSGPGLGKKLVFLTGDEEYRSEEALVQLAKILAVRHGFDCTVLFSIDAKTGTIDPNARTSLSDPAAIDQADGIVMSLRFREWPDEAMKHFVDAYLAGKPFVALRTSTHAFKYADNSASPYKRYSHNSKEWAGGFGRQVLGETWVSHLGKNHVEATRAVIDPAGKDSPLLRGVGPIFADTGAYTANPQPDSTILLRGQILAGNKPDSPVLEGPKNNPVQPVAWSRVHTNDAGKTNKLLCTTMGSATDLRDESLRRLLVNGVYWGLGMDVPEKADVRLVGEFTPSEYRPNGFRKGVKPEDLKIDAPR
jgi:hypothetical protein